MPLLYEYFAHIPTAAKTGYNNALVVDNQISNQIKSSARSLYHNLPSRPDCNYLFNKNFWTRALPIIKNDALNYYEQTPPLKPLIIKGLTIYGLYNYVLPGYISYPIIAAGTALAVVKVAPMLPYATQANTQLQAIGIDTQAIQDIADSTIEVIELANNNITVENIKNIPTTLIEAPSKIRNAVRGIAKNEVADAFDIDPNGPVNPDVIIDKLVRKTVCSVALYTTAATVTLFGAYKASMYCINKYQEYQKSHALDESIKQHLSDEKKAEIAQLTGKELSPDDLQEIINTIKAQATTAEDGRATQEIINLVVNEYVAKQVNA